MPTMPRRRRSKLRHAWPLAAIMLPVALFATPLFEAGITYDFRVSTTSGEGGNSKEVSVMAGRGQVTATSARIDLSEAKNGGPMFTGKDGYIIVKDGGAIMYMVDPGEKQYYAFNTEQMFAGLGSALKMMGGMVKMTMSDVKIDVQDMGAGERIQGHATRHVRQTQSHTMTVSVLGRKTVTKSSDTSDMWIAPELKLAGNPFLQMGAAASAIDFGSAEYKAQTQAAQAKIPAGFPLKAVTRSHATDEKGKSTLSVSTMEVTNFQKGDVPASAFAIPGDYKEVQMPFAELASMGDSLDAARARARADADNAVSPQKESTGEGLKDAVKDAGKQSVQEEAKKKLKGIFRKP